MRKFITVFLILALCSVPAYSWTFASIADFLNRDQLTQQQSIIAHSALQQIASFEPDFVLVPGDLVMGRWYFSKKYIQKQGNQYYTTWKKLFEQYGLKYYTAIGDHELGDLPSVNWLLQSYLIPTFQSVYKRNFDYPSNGPNGLKELAYYFIHKNTLFVTVQTFHYNGWWVQNKLSKGQLRWLNRVLLEHKHRVDHIIVQGHLPVLPVNNGKATSHLHVQGGHKSKFWAIMARHGVELYLCGEHHAVNVQKSDGITQIVHGGLIGTTPIHYVVIDIEGNHLDYRIQKVETSLIP